MTKQANNIKEKNPPKNRKTGEITVVYLTQYYIMYTRQQANEKHFHPRSKQPKVDRRPPQ